MHLFSLSGTDFKFNERYQKLECYRATISISMFILPFALSLYFSTPLFMIIWMAIGISRAMFQSSAIKRVLATDKESIKILSEVWTEIDLLVTSSDAKDMQVLEAFLSDKEFCQGELKALFAPHFDLMLLMKSYKLKKRKESLLIF